MHALSSGVQGRARKVGLYWELLRVVYSPISPFPVPVEWQLKYQLYWAGENLKLAGGFRLFP